MTTTTHCGTTPNETPNDWGRRAACVGMDGDVFFTATQTETAKRVCSTCPVRTECLDWALETRQDTGVWGGLTETERSELLRKKTPHTREVFVEKALKLKRPAVGMVLDQYWRVVELRNAGWGRRRLAADLRVSAESLVAAERLVVETGSVEAALESLAVTA